MGNYLLLNHHRAAFITIPRDAPSDFFTDLHDRWQKRLRGFDTGCTTGYYVDPDEIRDNVVVKENLTSASGMNFTLIPLPDATGEDLRNVKDHIKRTRDVNMLGTVRVLRWIAFQEEVDEIAKKFETPIPHEH